MSKKIYLDCTHTYNSGLNTGIQRVVKNIVKNSSDISKELNTEIIPVILINKDYYIFDAFPNLNNNISVKKSKLKIILKKLLNLFRKVFSKIKILNDILYSPKFILILNNYYERLFVNSTKLNSKVNFKEEDILLMIDSTWLNNSFQLYKDLKTQHNIKIASVVYDLIPINNKEFCSVDLEITLKNWFKQSINIIDKYICISKYVEKECFEYIKENLDKNISKEKFDYFYLGADLENNNIDENIINNSFKNLFTKDTYITVSTIEPRKNHEYVLNTFEKLWEKNIDINYVIIGRIGWEVDNLVNRIKTHKEYNNRLFLLENVDDKHLLYAYKNSKALIFASYVEGFGLPIIESLHNKLQVLASNIPIHKEIGKDNISYFDLDDNNTLVELIKNNKFNKNIENFSWLSWKEATKILLNKIND